MMRTVKKIMHFVIGLSFLPALLTYFAYGNGMDMIYFVITLLFCVGLLYLGFAMSKSILTVSLVLGILVLVIELIQLKQLWFNNQGGDPRVVIAFTVHAVFLMIVLVLLGVDRKSLNSI